MAGRDYSAGKAVGNNHVPQYDSPPPFKAIKQYVSENATASSVITLTDNTTSIEIGTGGTQAVMRWVLVADGTGAATSVIAVAGATANLDHTIPANTVRRFIVPIEIQAPGFAPNASIVGARVENGLFARLAYKTQGVASVLVTEYGSSNGY